MQQGQNQKGKEQKYTKVKGLTICTHNNDCKKI